MKATIPGTHSDTVYENSLFVCHVTFWLPPSFPFVSFDDTVTRPLPQASRNNLNCYISGVSNTRPARGSNAAREHQKKWRFERKNWVIHLIIPNKLNFNTQFKNFIFMRPARPYFESYAARESLWLWDPCYILCLPDGETCLAWIVNCETRRYFSSPSMLTKGELKSNSK